MAIFSGRKEQRLKKAFKQIQDEFEDHLEAINSNTQEICENRALIMALNDRITKLSDRMSEMKELLLNEPEAPEYSPVRHPLTLREQEVFLCLYTASSGSAITSVARQTGLPVGVVRDIIESLQGKGVPVFCSRDEDGLTFHLDDRFRDQQSRQNLAGIDAAVSRQISSELQLSLFTE